jgi:hypothetical protein
MTFPRLLEMDYQEGLTPADMRTLLRADKHLRHTCMAMRREGLLRRVGRGGTPHKTSENA